MIRENKNIEKELKDFKFMTNLLKLGDKINEDFKDKQKLKNCLVRLDILDPEHYSNSLVEINGCDDSHLFYNNTKVGILAAPTKKLEIYRGNKIWKCNILYYSNTKNIVITKEFSSTVYFDVNFKNISPRLLSMKDSNLYFDYISEYEYDEIKERILSMGIDSPDEKGIKRKRFDVFNKLNYKINETKNDIVMNYTKFNISNNKFKDLDISYYNDVIMFNTNQFTTTLIYDDPKILDLISMELEV